MKRVVLVFGLISGAIFVLTMAITIPMHNKGLIDHGKSGYIVGYATMVLAFAMVFVGIRSYRENVAGGAVSFGKAFQVGILITLISSAIYVISWEVTYFNFVPDFADKYAAGVLKDMHAEGASEADVAAKQKQLAAFAQMYKNPLINSGLTFLEVFPVGLVITLISAAILRKRAAAGARSAAFAA